MAADDPGESFGARFMEFYAGCSEDEQLFLAWLLSFSPDALAAASEPDVEGFAAPGSPTSGHEAPLAFNVQYFQLQSQVHDAGVSRLIMKSKHDTVKNSISNVR